jgi:hypothetical protein
MKLYVSAKTNDPTVVIDVLEVKLKDGRTLALDWDESNWSREVGELECQLRGIGYRGDNDDDDSIYANGQLAMFEGAELAYVQIYSDICDQCKKGKDTCAECKNRAFVITEVCFDDDGKTYSIPAEVIAAFYAAQTD